MSLSTSQVDESESTKSYAMDDFHNKSHFWGRLTLLLVIIASVSLPMYISFVLDIHPGWGMIGAGLIGYAGFIGIMWIIEPITYFPVLGIAGTYIAFLSGNIANLCLPCSSAAQTAIGAKPGTEKGEIAGVLGISVASLVNTVVITITVIGGEYVLRAIPDFIQSSLTFVLPAIFGAVLGQFAFSTPKYGAIALAVGLLVFFSPIPSFFKILTCVIIVIAVITTMENRKNKTSNA